MHVTHLSMVTRYMQHTHDPNHDGFDALCKEVIDQMETSVKMFQFHILLDM